ncbi:MAG: ComF family protein [Ruminococcus sp.]|nr:ComF family protein [Ruminococcus sp.]
MTDRKKMMLRRAANIIWTNECPVCHKLLEWDELLCEDCSNKLDITDLKLCPICSKQTCLDHTALKFSRVYAQCLYEDSVVNAIYDLKNGLTLNLAEYAAKELSLQMKEDGTARQIDLVTSVPMHFLKKQDKNINDADKLAKFFSSELDKPCDLKLLGKKRTKTVQHRLTAAQRKENAERSFFILPKHADITGKTLLLCDDVYTTGSTLNTCAGLLLEMGADEVICAAIATTRLEHERDKKTD